MLHPAPAPWLNNSIVAGAGFVDRVIVIPRNGYANRLQAWASGHSLAERIDAPLQILWEPEAVATTPAESLFSPELVSERFISGIELESMLGMPHRDFPRYLTYRPDLGVIMLAGHDRGEMAFMPELSHLLASLSQPTSLVVIAGGQFHLPGSAETKQARRAFYGQLEWSAQLNELFTTAVRDRPSYAALHVRQTDRSSEAPTGHALRAGLSRLRTLVSERSLLICADTEGARVQWTAEAKKAGFEPWSVEGVNFDRSSEDNGLFAMLDWRLMSSATGIVHPSASTFSTEAVVAGGTTSTSIALQAGALTRVTRRVGAVIQSVTDFPARRCSDG